MSVDPKREYREAAVRSATPVRLIDMLYEAAIEDLRRMSAAMGANDIQRRTDEAHHFLQVLNQLQDQPLKTAPPKLNLLPPARNGARNVRLAATTHRDQCTIRGTRPISRGRQP